MKIESHSRYLFGYADGIIFSTIVLDYSSPKMDKCYPKLEKKPYHSPKMEKKLSKNG